MPSVPSTTPQSVALYGADHWIKTFADGDSGRLRKTTHGAVQGELIANSNSETVILDDSSAKEQEVSQTELRVSTVKKSMIEQNIPMLPRQY